MRLEHQPRHLSQSGTELTSTLGLVDHDVPVVKLDSGLGHQGDYRLEGGLGSNRGEGAPVRFEGGGDGFWSSHLEVLDRCYCATGDRYFGTDDIARSPGGICCCGFGDHCEASGALGRHGVRQVVGLALTAHAGVDVDLLVPGGDIGGHHRFGLCQRGLGGQVPPRVRPEVIATKDYLLAREPHLIGDTVHLVAEGGRGQARVATFVVDLVAGRLDEHCRPIGGGLAYGCFDHHRMCRAHRGDAGRPDANTAAAGRDEGPQARRLACPGA